MVFSFGAMDGGERRRFNGKIVMIYKQTLQASLQFVAVFVAIFNSAKKAVWKFNYLSRAEEPSSIEW